ncbi:MAG: PspC family transcriptional regulator [Bacteroidia bacterium]
MNNFIEKIKTFFERQAFGVCEWLGEKLKIKSANIRLFFIYTSCLTIGSPLIIYLIMVFVLNLRKMVKSRRGSVWDM